MFYLLVMVPGSFEFGRSEITQGRMNAFVPIDLLDPVASTGRCEVPELGISVGEVLILEQIHLLFFDSADQTLGVSVLFGLAHSCIADLHTVLGKQISVSRGGILHTLVAVMDERHIVSQCASQRVQRQVLVQRTAQFPAADAACEYVHDDCKKNELTLQPDVGDTGTAFGASVSLAQACSGKVTSRSCTRLG